MTFGGNIGHEATDSCCYSAMDPDMALFCSMGWDLTRASGGSAGYSHQAVPHHPHISSSVSFIVHKLFLLLFAFHLSTTYFSS